MTILCASSNKSLCAHVFVHTCTLACMHSSADQCRCLSTGQVLLLLLLSLKLPLLHRHVCCNDMEPLHG